MSTSSGFVDRIKELVPAFREHGNIIWVWTEYRGNREVNDPSGNGCMVMIPEPGTVPDPSREQQAPASRQTPRSTRHNAIIERAMRMAAELDLEEGDQPTVATRTLQDPELFLDETPDREACCKPNTWGAEPISEIKDFIDPKDIQITKSYYSAFTETSLLLQLRAKLVTDLYFAGCNTNLSVFATATDVARHGLDINIIEDCLGCRQRDRHQQAVKQMVGHMGAQVTTAHSVIARLRGEEVPDDEDTEEEEDEEDASDDEASQPSTGPVRQSHFSQNRSDGSILSEGTTSTAAIDSFNVSITPTEHSESSRNGPAANAARFSFLSGAENQYQTTATAGDFGRERVNTTESMKAGENRADRHGLALLSRSLDTDGSSLVTRSHHAAAPPAPVAPLSSSNSQTNIHDSLRGAINPPITPNTMSSGPRVSAADPAGETPLARVRRPIKKKSWQRPLPTLGPGDAIGSGDSSIVFDLLPPGTSDTMFQQLLHEVHWQRMYHAAGEVPRLVCCQGDIDPVDGSMPVYRHPADQSLSLLHWSPGIARVRREAEKRVGHRLNHVLIQLYRSGQDHISEHSDKTLDIVPNSRIVNASFGSQRTMRLRTKRTASGDEQSEDKTTASTSTSTESQGQQRTTQRVIMPHNSMFIMGLNTNAVWLHGIMPDKRLAFERTPAELSHGGMRISLTFRNIGTYLSSDSRLIWGQGATAKERRSARPTINNDPKESQSLIDAFGFENQSTDFDWHRTYGSGFDVLHLKSPLQEQESPLLFLSGDEHADLAVKLYLAHLGVPATEIESSVPDHSPESPLLDANGVNLAPVLNQKQVVFRDTDNLHTQISGESATLLYLDRAYARYLHPVVLLQAARETELLAGSLLAESRDLLRQAIVEDWETVAANLHRIHALRELDDYLIDSRRDFMGNSQQQQWLAGAEFGIADCAFWSVVQAFRALFIQRFERVFPGLNDWAGRVQGREEVARLRGGGGGGGRSRRSSISKG